MQKSILVWVLLAAICCTASLGVCAEPKEEALFNAALAYWPAAVWLLDRKLSIEERKILAAAETVPLDDQAAELVKSCDSFLSEVHRGARSPHCDWGVDFSAGPWTTLPHFDYFGNYAVGLLMLRARLSLREGNDESAESAADDLGAALMVARHLSSDRLLIGVNFRCLLERKIIQVPADNLENIYSRARLKLQSHINRLPPATTTDDGILREKQVMLNWLRRSIEKDGPEGAARELRLLFVGEQQGQQQKRQLAEQVARADEQTLAEWLRESEQLYDDTAAYIRGPLAGFDDAHAEATKKLAEANPLIRLLVDESLMKSIADIRRRELTANVRMAMLRAALSIAYYKKPSELAEFTDPAGDGPFRFEKLEDGFRLESTLRGDGKPFAMTFHAKVR